MHINEVYRRARNAATAGLGATGLSILNMYRTSQEMEYVADSFKIMKMSSWFGAAAGALWFFMPKADADVEETIEETKEVLKEPISVLIKRTIEEQKEFVADMKAKRYRTTTNWTRPYSSTSTTSSSTIKGAASVVTSIFSSAPVREETEKTDWKAYTNTYQRGFEKVKTPVQDVEDDGDNAPGWSDEDEINDAVFQEELEEYMARLEREDRDD